MTARPELLLLLLLLPFLPSCTVYRSTSPGGGSVFLATTVNGGVLTEDTTDGVLSTAATPSVASLASLASLSPSAPPFELRTPDGFVMTGTVDHSTSLREVGRTLRALPFIDAMRALGLKMVGRTGDVAETALRR
jgi:hypothetical protein